MMEHPTSPTTLPTLAFTDQKAKSIPRFYFPNQLAITVIIPGHPTPWKNPFRIMLPIISPWFRLEEIQYSTAIPKNEMEERIIPAPRNQLMGTLLMSDERMVSPKEQDRRKTASHMPKNVFWIDVDWDIWDLEQAQAVLMLCSPTQQTKVSVKTSTLWQVGWGFQSYSINLNREIVFADRNSGYNEVLYGQDLSGVGYYPGCYYMKHEPLSLDTLGSEIKVHNHSELEISTIYSESPSLFGMQSQIKPLFRFCGYQLLNYGPDINSFLRCFTISVLVTIIMGVLASFSNMPPFMTTLLYSINLTQNITYLLTATLNPGVIRENEKEKWNSRLTECKRCNIFREVSSTHCSQCESCIKGFDHHCPFVGKCIGRYNLIPFALFMMTTATGFLYNFVFAIGTLSMIKPQ